MIEKNNIIYSIPVCVLPGISHIWGEVVTYLNLTKEEVDCEETKQEQCCNNRSDDLHERTEIETSTKPR